MTKVEFDSNGAIARLKSLADPLTENDIREAVAKFNALDRNVDTYSHSTTYDLIVDGERYPPKAIFGIAMSNLLGIQVVSTHFSAGLKSPCFTTFKQLGFDIVEKNVARVVRKQEKFQYENLEVGHEYSKAEALQTAKVAPPINNKEIVGANEFKNCVVLFVTLDKTNKDKRQQYKDSFQLDGKLFQWESKKTSNLNSSQIRKVLDPDRTVPVLLFVRITEKIKGVTQPFVYAGLLAWREYSGSKESSDQPVEVMFDVLDYKEDAPNTLQAVYSWRIDGEGPIKVTSTVLTKSTPPKPSKKRRAHKSSNSNKENSAIDWAKKDESNRSLGNAGEELVLKYERNLLTENNLEHLANKIEHVAKNEPSAGYDIKSFNLDETEKYIEVKTTRGSKATPFYISRNEVEKSSEHGEKYWIYRVYNLNTETNQASFYELNGPVEQHFNLEPETYKASKK